MPTRELRVSFEEGWREEKRAEHLYAAVDVGDLEAAANVGDENLAVVDGPQLDVGLEGHLELEVVDHDVARVAVAAVAAVLAERTLDVEDHVAVLLAHG